jgi:hypothetical protein
MVKAPEVFKSANFEG